MLCSPAHGCPCPPAIVAQAYENLRGNPKIEQLAKKIEHYQLLTESFWMIDAQVETIPDMKRFRDDVRGLYIVFVKKYARQKRWRRGAGGQSCLMCLSIGLGECMCAFGAGPPHLVWPLHSWVPPDGLREVVLLSILWLAICGVSVWYNRCLGVRMYIDPSRVRVRDGAGGEGAAVHRDTAHPSTLHAVHSPQHSTPQHNTSQHDSTL